MKNPGKNYRSGILDHCQFINLELQAYQLSRLFSENKFRY